METMVLDNGIFFENVEQLLSEGEDVKILVKGYSMTPTFRHLVDVIVLSRFNPDSLASGDVVLFMRSDRHICVHRIIRREGETLYIRGDGNIGRFEVAKVSDVMAKVTSGTMLGGHPFTISDKQWKQNTNIRMRIYPLYYLYRRCRNVCGKVYYRWFNL